MHLVRHRRDEVPQEVSRHAGGGLFVQLDEGELGGSVDRDEQVKLALFGANLGDVDVEVADRVALELPLGGLLAFDPGQPRNAMALQAAVQRRAGQVRDRRLKRVEAIIQRQQRMAPERDRHRLVLDRERA